MADRRALKKIRDENIARILQSLIKAGSLSRIEIAGICRLAPGTITQLVVPLLNAGIVEEFKTGDSTGGRKPVYLRIVPDYGCVAVFEIRQNGLSAKIDNLHGESRRK
jgi:predicted transcriptional regulator